MIDIDKFADEVINKFRFMTYEERQKYLDFLGVALCGDEEDLDEDKKILHYHMDEKRFFN